LVRFYIKQGIFFIISHLEDLLVPIDPEQPLLIEQVLVDLQGLFVQKIRIWFQESDYFAGFGRGLQVAAGEQLGIRVGRTQFIVFFVVDENLLPQHLINQLDLMLLQTLDIALTDINLYILFQVPLGLPLNYDLPGFKSLD